VETKLNKLGGKIPLLGAGWLSQLIKNFHKTLLALTENKAQVTASNILHIKVLLITGCKSSELLLSWAIFSLACWILFTYAYCCT